MITNIHKIFKGRTWGMAVASSTLLAACGSVPESAVKPIKIDGSSKVFPITEIVLETYKSEAANQSIKELKIEGEFSGTGGGFQKFCAGETDISAASRPISQEEMATCKNNEISKIELDFEKIDLPKKLNIPFKIPEGYKKLILDDLF